LRFEEKFGKAMLQGDKMYQDVKSLGRQCFKEIRCQKGEYLSEYFNHNMQQKNDFAISAYFSV